jgi:serine phosphatase RsbU (regulator of sigma subunit)
MGKGMPAAILMAIMRIALRTSFRLPSVAEAVQSVQDSTIRDLEKAQAFMTLFHGRIDLDTGVLTYVDAGHGLLLVVRADGSVQLSRRKALPMGVLPDQRYTEGRMTVRPGDSLVVFSDGVLDLYPELERPELAADLLRGAVTAQEMADRLAGDPEAPRATDDITVIVLRRLARTAPRAERRSLSPGVGGRSPAPARL